MKENMADKAKLIQIMSEYLNDGKLSCHDAFKINELSGFSLREIGKISNEMNIKICACQLGCFK
jgi:hypothetical protein